MYLLLYTHTHTFVLLSQYTCKDFPWTRSLYKLRIHTVSFSTKSKLKLMRHLSVRPSIHPLPSSRKEMVLAGLAGRCRPPSPQECIPALPAGIPGRSQNRWAILSLRCVLGLPQDLLPIGRAQNNYKKWNRDRITGTPQLLWTRSCSGVCVSPHTLQRKLISAA